MKLKELLDVLDEERGVNISTVKQSRTISYCRYAGQVEEELWDLNVRFVNINTDFDEVEIEVEE